MKANWAAGKPSVAGKWIMNCGGNSGGHQEGSDTRADLHEPRRPACVTIFRFPTVVHWVFSFDLYNRRSMDARCCATERGTTYLNCPRHTQMQHRVLGSIKGQIEELPVTTNVQERPSHKSCSLGEDSDGVRAFKSLERQLQPYKIFVWKVSVDNAVVCRLNPINLASFAEIPNHSRSSFNFCNGFSTCMFCSVRSSKL